MKKIEAIIRNFKLSEVRLALSAIGISSMTITEVAGLGHQEGYIENYRGIKNHVDFLNNLKIEIIVADELIDDCIEVICSAARTGQVGDGKIFVTDVEKIIRIRTGEENENAV